MEKHLEILQGIINRMSQNSFLIKGWAIALVSALFALAAKDTNKSFAFIAFFPTIVFWFLDSYYLYQEKLYRKVYNRVRIQTITDYSVDILSEDKGIYVWLSAAFSFTLIVFYGIIILTISFIIYSLSIYEQLPFIR